MKKVLLPTIVVVIAIAVLGLVAWAFLPPLLVDLDFGERKIGDDVRAQALAASRQSVLLVVGGLIALVGVVVTVTRLYLEREADTRAAAAHDLDRDENLTSRYATAIEELGSERAEIQLGGIYALERLARDSPADKLVIGEVLASFIRTRSSSEEPRTEPERAAIRVVTRASFNGLDLTGARLNDLDLSGASLPGFHLIRVNLDRTLLDEADLRGALIQDVTAHSLRSVSGTFDTAVIDNCTFVQSEFFRTSFVGAVLSGCTFNSSFEHVDFASSRLGRVDFKNSRLSDVDFSRSSLSAVDMSAINAEGPITMAGVLFQDTISELPAVRPSIFYPGHVDLTDAIAMGPWPINMEAHAEAANLVDDEGDPGYRRLRKA